MLAAVNAVKRKETEAGALPKAQAEPAEPFTLTRDHEWLQKTTSNLRGLFADVFSVSKTMLQQHWYARGHDNMMKARCRALSTRLLLHRRVRKSLARCAGRLLLNCRITLDSCANFFLSTLVFLAKDDFNEVSTTAQEEIKVGPIASYIAQCPVPAVTNNILCPDDKSNTRG